MSERQADWGDRVGKAAFASRYGVPFRGDGWYLLELDGQRSAQLSKMVGGKVDTRGWLVADRAAFDELKRDEGPGLRLREETW